LWISKNTSAFVWRSFSVHLLIEKK
jgi:hypothetical protein